MSFFTYEDGSLLVRLLIAHCLTDFFLQPDHWVADKKQKNLAIEIPLVSWVGYWPCGLDLYLGSKTMVGGIKYNTVACAN